MKSNTMFNILLDQLRDAQIDAHTSREKCGNLLGDLRLKQIKIEGLESRIREQARIIAQLGQREPRPGEPLIEDVPF